MVHCSTQYILNIKMKWSSLLSNLKWKNQISCQGILFCSILKSHSINSTLHTVIKFIYTKNTIWLFISENNSKDLKIFCRKRSYNVQHWMLPTASMRYHNNEISMFRLRSARTRAWSIHASVVEYSFRFSLILFLCVSRYRDYEIQ